MNLTAFFGNIIKRFSPFENPSIPLNSPDAYAIFANPTSAGVPITYRALMGYPPIRKGVSLIAGHVAKLPIYVYRTKGDGSRVIDYNHPAYQLLAKRPADLYSAFVFKRQMIAYMLIYGNAYAFIQRDDFGRPTEMLLLNPESTYVSMTGGKPIYRTTTTSTEWILDAADVFHLKDFGDGIAGDGLLSIARDALGNSLAMLRYSNAYFRNGAHGDRFIILSAMLNDNEKRKQFVTEYKAQYAGANNAFKDKWLPNGSEVKETGNDPDKSQLLASREHDLIQVADLLNVPPHKLGANISTSYSSLASENQAFLDDCLDFHLVNFAQEAEAKLLLEAEKDNNLRDIDFDRTELLRMDPKTEGELRIAKLNNGVISWQEARLQENLPPEKDDDSEWRHAANIVIEGEEPEPVEPPQQPPEAQQPQAPDTPDANNNASEEKPEDKAGALARGIIVRLLTRVEKSVCEQKKLDLVEHLDIFTESLAVYRNAEEWSADLLDRLEAELKAVLPEQRQEVFSRLDIDKELGALCS